MSAPLLELKDVSKRFVKHLDFAERAARLLGSNVETQVVHAVDGVSFSVDRREVVGLVGESGCGKSTLGRVIAGIYPPTGGHVLYRGEDVAAMSPAEAKAVKLKAQMIFQDPLSSLNPRRRVRDIIGEAPKVHGLIPAKEIDDYVEQMMVKVGLDPTYKTRYPHQFSGGQRQRISIARALAVNPEFLICDESVAALDVSIQAQVLNLFMKLREALDLTILFISHNLGVVKHLSHRIVIMYLGRVVEVAQTEELFEHPNHPYTQALLREVPTIDTGKREYEPIKGELPSPLHPPPGCHFHPRCPYAMDRCRSERPALKSIGDGRLSACHLNDEPTRPSA